ncbi:MAG: hypothetical protein KAH38_12645, partial [Candidatus Hydrogenedentes bacterium]|nr:hypothetical protein [Candidatus Hydrogenedentota bacterium]
MQKKYVVNGLVLVLLVVGMGAYADVPDTITVHGQLLDDTGVPLTGNRDYQIVFYDTDIFGSVLGGVVTGTTELSPEGVFNISVVLPEEAKAAAELWYEIAVDS